MEVVQRLHQQLVADRVQQECEVDEQRKWCEEQVQQGKDHERLDEIMVYLNLIAKLAEKRKADSTGLSMKLHVVPLGAEDNIEVSHYIRTYIDGLTGKAQLAFAALLTTSSDDYEAIQAAI